VQDRKFEVSTGCAVAVALWGVTIGCLALSWAERDVYLATVACMVGLAAGTLTIRQFFVTHERLMRNAFDLGCDAGRLEGHPSVPEQRGMYPVR
jgi:hypothetical protein